MAALLLSITPTQAELPAYVESTIGNPGAGNGQFDGPASVLRLYDRYYVLEESNHRVQIFDLDWNYVDQFGGLGAGNGQLSLPRQLATNGTHIFVTETGNHRVSIFSPNGGYVGHFDPGFGSITGIAVDTGKIYVTDYQFDKVWVINMTTLTLITTISAIWSDPWAVTVAEDRLYVVDQTEARVHIFNKDNLYKIGEFGASGEEVDKMNSPSSITSVNGYLLITTWSLDGIKVFDQNGNFVTSINSGAENPGLPHVSQTSIYLPDNFGDTIQKLRIVNAPQSLMVRPGADSISMNWQFSMRGGMFAADSFRIYRDAGAGFELIGEVDTPYFVDQAASTSTEYVYGIQSVAKIGVSTMTESASVSAGESATQNTTGSGNNDGFLSDVPLSIPAILTGIVLLPLIRKRNRKR
jgi:YVTN family beta-propeller protein